MSPAEPPSDGAGPPSRASPALGVAAAATAFALLALFLSALRVVELHANVYDLGLYEQALWTGSHGGAFYESADFEKAGLRSLLGTYGAVALYGLAPIYRLAPGPWILLVLQSVGVAVAAGPLYLLARAVPGGSTRSALLATLLYLAWAPLLASTLYDFHIEAFVPALLFATAWLATRRRDAAALAVAAIAGCFGDYVGVLVVALGLFFLWERVRAPTPGSSAPVGRRRGLAALATREVLGAALLVCVGLATYAIFAWYAQVAPGAAPTAAGPTGLTTALSVIPRFEDLSAGGLATGFWTKVSMAVAAYLLVGGLPLLAPRTQVVAVPVLALGFLAPETTFLVFGYQYAFLLAVPVFLGVAFALPEALRVVGTFWEALRPSRATTRRRRAVRWLRPLPVLVAVLVLVNLGVGPADPLMQGSPDFGPGYLVSYVVPAGFGSAAELASHVPPGATVLSTDDLFPLVANDPQAYVLPTVAAWARNLPFSPGDLPAYVLVSTEHEGSVPTWLVNLLYDASDYRIAGVAWSTPVGPVALFGPPDDTLGTFYGGSPQSTQSFAPSQLSLGPAALGLVPPGHGAPQSYVASRPGEAGVVWYGPYAGLAPGAYTASLTMRAIPVPGGGGPTGANQTVLSVSIYGFAQPDIARAAISTGDLSGGAWVTVQVPFTIAAPTLGVEVAGIQGTLFLEVDLAGLSFAPT